MTTVSDMLSYGLIVTGVGMGMTFIVLIGLAYMLGILKVLSNKGTEKKTEIIKLDDTEEPLQVTEASAEDEGEIVAAIIAALSVFMGSSSNLIVRSVKRVEDNAPVWAKVGRHEQMLN
ncbi:MAG TPA: OadG family protein, partial [Bacillota bacterium]|nr:OadG family protein [Bacillota bacterium]